MANQPGNESNVSPPATPTEPRQVAPPDTQSSLFPIISNDTLQRIANDIASKLYVQLQSEQARAYARELAAQAGSRTSRWVTQHLGPVAAALVAGFAAGWLAGAH